MVKNKNRIISPIKNWRLYLIIDPELYPQINVFEVTKEAIAAGISAIQLRVKQAPSRDFFHLASQLTLLLQAASIPFIINDRVDIALACGADGVHLGQQDLPLEVARKILGPNKIIGLSVNTVAEAWEAEKKGADYLGVGPIFPTSSKKDIRNLLGLSGLKKIREATSLPLMAIGGINLDNAAAVLQAGADGVAVISAILGAANPSLQIKKFLQVLS